MPDFILQSLTFGTLEGNASPELHATGWDDVAGAEVLSHHDRPAESRAPQGARSYHGGPHGGP